MQTETGTMNGRRRGAIFAWLLIPIVALTVWVTTSGVTPTTYWRIQGRVEFPVGWVNSGDLFVWPSRNGKHLFGGPTPPGASGWGSVRADGGFDVYMMDGEPVDLQVEETFSLAAIRLGPDGKLTPEDVARLSQLPANLPHPDVTVRRVGDYEAIARNVVPGAPDVVLRLVPRVARPVACRVVDPEGTPVAGSKVTLHSLADWIHGTTDAQGRVTLDDVSVREYEVTASVPDDQPPGLVRARILATPGDDELVLPLRRGVPVRVRVARPLDQPLYLAAGLAPRGPMYIHSWRPDATGVAVIYAEPQWDRLLLHLLVEEPRSRGGYSSLVDATVAIRPDAEVTLTPKE